VLYDEATRDSDVQGLHFLKLLANVTLNDSVGNAKIRILLGIQSFL